MAGEFPGAGVWKFKPFAAGSRSTAVDARLLAMDFNGDVVADFRASGSASTVPTGGWQILNGHEATL